MLPQEQSFAVKAMFPSCEMVPSCKTSDALLLQECNKYTGWIRLRIHAGYKCDSKWLSMITVRQDRRKYSLLAVIVHIELLSSYLYFPKCLSKAWWRQEPFPVYVCTCVPETWKQIRRAPRFLHGMSCREMQEGTQRGDAQCLMPLGCWLPPGGAGLIGRAQLALSKRMFLQDCQASGLQPDIGNCQAST